MIKTKLFSWQLDEMNERSKKIDTQINEFVERNRVSIVDVKLAVQSNSEDCWKEMTALVLYKENL